jgi:hypothetical protein
MVEAEGESIPESLRRSNSTERQWVGEPSSGMRTLRDTAVIPQNSNDAKKETGAAPKEEKNFIGSHSLGVISPRTSPLDI